MLTEQDREAILEIRQESLDCGCSDCMDKKFLLSLIDRLEKENDTIRRVNGEWKRESEKKHEKILKLKDENERLRKGIKGLRELFRDDNDWISVKSFNHKIEALLSGK